MPRVFSLIKNQNSTELLHTKSNKYILEMEEVLMRFHQIGKKIFEELNNQSLINCKKVSGSWRNFIDGEKTVFFRIIKFYTNVPDTYLDKKFGKANLNIVRELAKNIQHVYRKNNV